MTKKQAAKTAEMPAPDIATVAPKPSLPAKVAPVPRSMITVIARAAADPKLNADKMRTLLDMQKEIMAEEARLSFVRSFRRMRQVMPVINRDGKIEVRKKDRVTGERTGDLIQTTHFATYENLMEVCEPIFLEHGFSFASGYEPAADGLRINVVSFLDHDDGHQRLSRFPLPAETSGSKNNVQGWGSSGSYGKRYNAIALLNILSRDPRDADRDGNTPVVSEVRKGPRGGPAKEREVPPERTIDATATVLISEEQLAALNAKMIACKVPLAKVLKAYNIEKLEQLPANLLDRALNACDIYKKNQEDAQAHG